jgi:GNAT superfamily N-acetyltransferase
MPLEFAIRQGRSDDAATIVQFQIDMAAETEDMHLDPPTVQKGVRGILDDSSKGEYWVATLAEDVVVGGLLLTFEWSDWRNAQIVWIQSVYVTPEYRRQGVFRNLLQHVQQLVAQRDDWCGVRLYVDNGNEDAQSTYRNLGMNGDHYRVFEWM